MLIVAALGGNALLRRGEPMTAAAQRANIVRAADALAPLLRDHQVVITHGNGPQVGLLALQNNAYPEVDPYPLDVLDAETEGMIGYMLEIELGRHHGARRIATILTQVVVDPNDPAFARPTKFIGPVYDRDHALAVASSRGWSVAPDGDRWRRVVASPEPQTIVEIDAIRTLLDAGYAVICAGGGGIPVTSTFDGVLTGCEAVIDKDLVSAKLATDLGADALLLLTDVDAVYADWGMTDQRPLRRTTVRELRSLALAGGSMGPKAEAVCRFVEHGGMLAAIGSLSDASRLLMGAAGTVLGHAVADQRSARTEMSIALTNGS